MSSTELPESVVPVGTEPVKVKLHDHVDVPEEGHSANMSMDYVKNHKTVYIVGGILIAAGVAFGVYWYKNKKSSSVESLPATE